MLSTSSWRLPSIEVVQPPQPTEEEGILAWIVRLLMIVAGAVTSWVVARDAPNFEVIQMMVALLLLTLVVAVLAFGPPAGRSGSTDCRDLDSRHPSLGRKRDPNLGLS
jgi:hypothetical protein